MALVRLKPKRGRLAIIAGDNPHVVAPASHLTYQGPTASPSLKERPVFDRGLRVDYQRENGYMPTFSLRGFLSGLGRADLSGILEKTDGLEIELEGWGRVKLVGVAFTSWTLRPEPHGLWVEMAGQVKGASRRRDSSLRKASETQ